MSFANFAAKELMRLPNDEAKDALIDLKWIYAYLSAERIDLADEFVTKIDECHAAKIWREWQKTLV